MSNKKKWNILSCSADLSKVESISNELGVMKQIALLMYNRGFHDTETARRFLKKEEEMFYDPYLIKDMDLGVNRIINAIKDKEKIVIYGDYDVDGVTSVSTLYLFLKNHTQSVSYYIPDRNSQGYGVSTQAISEFKEDGVSLMITVDTGITAACEVEFAKELGIDVVITDHHECHADLPSAVACINPRRDDCSYPFKELAGVGVVFKLICALETALTGVEPKEALKKICREYIDLVAIGTIADVMPLIDENRLIVSLGLGFMQNTQRLALKTLFEFSGIISSQNKMKKITSSVIGFTVAPRINAAGRLSTATTAVELFLTDSQERAKELVGTLFDLNKQRQGEENKIIKEARSIIENEHNLEEEKVLVISSDGWNNGVIGIVASRFTEQYNMPTILVSFDGEQGKGSGRSVKGFNLVNALSYSKDTLVKFGGHELAAGLSIERSNLDAFVKKINEYALENMSEEDYDVTIDIDSELEMSDATIGLARELYCLEPYGISNPIPVFVTKRLTICSVMSIGEGRHTKFVFSKDGKKITGLYFGMNCTNLDFYRGDTVDVVYNLDINDYQDVQSAQMIIKDMELSSDVKEKLDLEKEIFEEITNGRKISADEDYFPDRDDFAGVYTFIRQCVRQNFDVMTAHYIIRNVPGINYVKLRIIINVLNELNALGIEFISEDKYKFKINVFKTKTSLDKSTIYRKLKPKT